jgi:hypothetical protein
MLHLIKNLTPLRAFHMRKIVQALKVNVWCYYYYEGSFIAHEASVFTILTNKKRRRLPAFQECSNTLPWGFDRRYASGLDFSITTYGSAHLASSLSLFLVRGLRKRTRLPISLPCLLQVIMEAALAMFPCWSPLLSIDQRLVTEWLFLPLGVSTSRRISLVMDKQANFCV